MRTISRLFALAAPVLFAACRGTPPAPAAAPAAALPAHGVIGVEPMHLDAEFWVGRDGDAGRVIMSPAAITAQNAAMLARDSSVFDLTRLPDSLDCARVQGWISRLSAAPSRTLYDEAGAVVDSAEIARLVAEANVDGVPMRVGVRFGLVVRRADLRTFSTTRRVFSSRGNTDIDRWQESAEFPGTPVAVLHESRDGQWWFAMSRTYAAWVRKADVAIGTREEALGYAQKAPFLVVTGARIHTVFTPERPAVSEVPLEMGARLPLLDTWPANRAVNGQHPYGGWVVELPVRAADGSLSFAPALIPRSADVSRGYLPLTAAGILRQAFKFQGERYGWGHGYHGRDCSGFVGEVYRTFGIELPRNTGDQAVSPALNRTPLTAADDHARRLSLLAQTRTGDLIYVPGHVMMVVGHVGGEPYVIHDVTGINYRGPDGAVVRVSLNAVAVTAFVPLANAEVAWADRVTSLVRIRP